MRLLIPLVVLGFVHCAPAATPPNGVRGPVTDPVPVADPVVPVTPPSSAAPALEARLRERIAREPQGTVGLALVDLGSGLRLGIDDTVRMHAASTMKVPVMLELFRRADAGRLALDDSLVVRNEFTSIADGSRYALTPADDSDPDLYDRIGRRASYRELVHRMIARSSNLATNILIEHADPDSIRATLAAIGAGGMHVLRGVEDIPAFERGMNNTTTADGLARVLEFIARCEAGEPHTAVRLSPGACRAMTDILDDQHFTARIPAGLPPGVRVANKTGWITGIDHDGAIVYPPGREPYVLVILTRGLADTLAAGSLARDLSRIVWDALTDARIAWRPDDPDARDRLAEYAQYRVGAITAREFTHDEYWRAVGPIIDESPVLEREEVGRSAEGRPIYRVRYGHGPTRVLLWSQMHGDESTATMALADLFRYFATAREDVVARRIADRLSVYFVPLLNPDGAERFRRRNALGIDVNRDARRLSTPEARALKAVQERLRPAFGFNLHDQNVRTRVGRSDRLAAIALLAPRPNASGSETEGMLRAQRLAAVVRHAVEPLVPGHVTRYDDTFNPRAFGDLMQQWGVSTVLIESGGWEGDVEKQYLRAVNFIGIRAALDAIATGAYARADRADYLSLEQNGRAVNDVLVAGGTIVIPGLSPYRADLVIDFTDPLERRGARLRDAGDLAGVSARDTLDASGLFVHVAESVLDAAGGLALDGGGTIDFTVRRGSDPASPAVWIVEDGRARRAGTPATSATDPAAGARRGGATR